MTKTPSSPTARSATFRTAPWYSWATAVPRAVTAPLWAKIYTRKLGVRTLKHLPTTSWKRGRTAFIMGSGPSINELTEQQWKVIRAGTTIGVNWWTMHDYVPDLYVFENLSERHRRMILSKSQAYANTPMVLKQFLSNFSPATHWMRMNQIALLPKDLRSRLYLSSDLLIPGRTEAELRRAYRNMERIGFLASKERFQWVMKRTGSLTFLINLCVRAGFEEIVLCGVDLNRAGTFYEPDPGSDSIGTVHGTQDPSAKVLPISEVLRLFNEELLRDRNVTVSIAYKASLLAKCFPVYDWATNAAQGCVSE